MAIQFYTPSSDGPVSGFMEGRKFKQDELYRQATQQLAAQEAALLKMGGYMKPSAAQGGYVSGYEENQDNIRRDQGPMESNVPQFFKKVLNPATPPSPDPMVAVDKNITVERARKAAEAEAARNASAGLQATDRAPQSMDMPSGPQPLLKPKDKTEFVGEPKPIVPGVSIQPVKQELNFEDRPVVGPTVADRELPAQPEVVQDFNPSPMMRAKIQEMMTAQAAKDTDPQVPVNSLPPNLREKLGIPADFQGSIRSSILKEMIQGSYRPQPVSATKPSPDVDPAVYEAADRIKSGEAYGLVARQTAAKLQRALRPSEDSILKAMIGQAQREKALTVRTDIRNKEDDEKNIQKLGVAYDKTGISAALPALRKIDDITKALSSKSPNTDKLPGYGTNALRSIPILGTAAASIATKSFGGEEVQQALQVLANTQIRNNSGQAVSKSEEGRNLIALGMQPGGNERDVINGLRLYAEGLKEAESSVRARFDGGLISKFKEGGGPVGEIDQMMKKRSDSLNSGKPSADSGYEQELNRARQKMQEFRSGLQEQMAKGKATTQSVSRMVESQKQKVDAFLKNKYGKGYNE